MSGVEVLVAVLIAVGLVGVLLPLVPGSLLVVGAILLWAADVATPTAWTCFALAAVLIGLGLVVKYVVPGRRLRQAGIPTTTMLLGAVVGVVGFFVVPVIGLPLGFVAGVYLAELGRLGSRAAWPATVQALRAVGLSLVVELTAGVLAAGAWAVGVVLT